MRRRNLGPNYKLQITNRKLERGYILITLMLLVALIAITLLTVLPRMKQQIQRNQEEELRHRGSAYMRAIQHFYKKFGRYPTRIEELENTNNLRFLRKRYKDPINGKDFKILHMQDVNLNSGPVLGQIPGQGGLTGPGGPFGSSGPGGPGGFPGAFGQPGQFGGLQRTVSQSQSGSSDNSTTDNSGNSQSSPGSSGSSSSSSSPSPDSGSSGSSTGPSSSSGSNQTVFGGGPILGVASTSTAITIREFDKKNHYKDWLFIYDPTSDRGGLLVGPWQTGLSGGLGGAGLGTPVQNLSRPPQGMGLGGILQPAGNQPQGTPQTPQNPPQNEENNPNQ